MIERVVVLGAGAVGGTIAALLDSLSVPVVLIARGAHGAALRESGLTLRMPDRVLRRRILVAALPAEVDWQPSDLCLLSTKLQDAEAALEQVLAAAGPKLPIACAVNGLHGERWAASRFETVLSTLVWVVATHLVPGEVRLYSSRRLGVLDSGPTQGDPDG
ncbi:MAG: 2-dehydropantoate 2-reductase, partial [Planctomycetota bacterium]